jgi:hypothetical protein
LYLLLCTLLLSCKQFPNSTEIPLTIIGNKAHVTARIGEIYIPEILLDTGFAFDGLMIYNPDYQDSLDLAGGMEINIGGAGAGEASKALLLDSSDFYLANLHMQNQKLLILLGDVFKGFPSNGLMGYSIFGHYITEFNYDDNTLLLHDTSYIPADNDWSQIPLYFKENKIPWLELSIVTRDEKPVKISAYIDYAAHDAILLLERPDMKFSLPKDLSEVYIGRGLSGDIYGKSGSIAKLIIGPYQMENVVATVAKAEVRSKQPDADAIIGIEVLRRYNHIFDYGKKRLYLKPNLNFSKPYTID